MFDLDKIIAKSLERNYKREDYDFLLDGSQPTVRVRPIAEDCCLKPLKFNPDIEFAAMLNCRCVIAQPKDSLTFDSMANMSEAPTPEEPVKTGLQYKKIIPRPEIVVSSHPVGNSIIGSKQSGKAMANALDEIYGREPIRLICRGSSGAILAAIVATHMDNVVEIIHIKKPGEACHDSGHQIKHYHVKYNIIIDDFICSGITIRETYERFMAANDDQKIDCLIIGGPFTPRHYSSTFRDMNIDDIICTSTEEGI